MLDFIQAFPAALGRRLRPLVAPEFTASQLRAAHDERRRFGAVHALGVWALQDLTVAGVNGHLFLDNDRFNDASVVPRYVEILVDQGHVRPYADLALPERVIEEPVVVFMGWGQTVYGHVLMDTTPKIGIAARALGAAPGSLPFLLSRAAPPWLRSVLAFAGAERFVEYDPANERMLLRRAWVVTHPSVKALHPACADFFAALRPSPKPGAGDAMFVTRRAARVTRRIQMLNLPEIEETAQRAGLRVVSPEQAPIGEQAQLFADARLVVGEYGSGLNNAVFCRPGAVVGAIGTRSGMQSAISALCGLRQSYFDPTGHPEDPAGYTVDPDAFARWLDALLRAAENPGERQTSFAASG